ncbi:MAG: hypothetical protein V1858_05455 [Candidatus Gottesmanbacteria bacterium]
MPTLTEITTIIHKGFNGLLQRNRAHQESSSASYEAQKDPFGKQCNEARDILVKTGSLAWDQFPPRSRIIDICESKRSGNRAGSYTTLCTIEKLNNGVVVEFGTGQGKLTITGNHKDGKVYDQDDKGEVIFADFKYRIELNIHPKMILNLQPPEIKLTIDRSKIHLVQKSILSTKTESLQQDLIINFREPYYI